MIDPLENRELLETLMAGSVPEDLALKAHRLAEQYADDHIPHPFSGDHITTTLHDTAPATIPGWVHPLTVDPDDRVAVTAANLEAIKRHQNRNTP